MRTWVRPARREDFDAWIELARAMEPLFGPMADVEEFQTGLRTVIDAGAAFSAGIEESFAGGIVIDPGANAVVWLAVSATARGLGLGSELMRAGLAALDSLRPVSVQTFAPGVAEGAAARRLYARFGFAGEKPAEPTPTGIATVVMARPAGQWSGAQ